MKKIKIVYLLLLITIVVINITSINVFAVSNSPVENPDYWVPSVTGDATLNEKIGVILGFIQVLGIAISIIVLMIMGIKYMMGSAEEKAANKSAVIPYLVGAVMVFAVTTIPNFIYIVTESFFSEEEYAWITYDCNSKGHEFGIYSDGRCNHFEVCGWRCNHKTDKGWTESTLNGTRTCNTCYWTCTHQTLSHNEDCHYCSTCGGGQENHIWNPYNPNRRCEIYACDYKCEHVDSNGQSTYSDGVCRCGNTCEHKGTRITYTPIDNWYHKCDACGYDKVGHDFELINEEGEYACFFCKKLCTHDRWITELNDYDDFTEEDLGTCWFCRMPCSHDWERGKDESWCITCGLKCTSHSFDYNSQCTRCGYTCTHDAAKGYSDREHYCSDCNVVGSHEWRGQNGECGICDYICPHNSISYYGMDTCDNCGFVCYHTELVKLDAEYHQCNICKILKEPHTFSGYNYDIDGNVVCDSCGTRCEHLSYEILSDNQHQCKQCGEISNHSYSSPFGKMVCSVCDNYCGHNAEPTIKVDETSLGVYSMWFCGACKKDITGNINIFMDYNRNNGNVDDMHLYSMVYEEKYKYYTPVLVTKYTIYVNGDEYKTINNDYIAGLGYSESMLVSKFLSTWQKEKGGEIIGAQIYVEGTKKDGTTIKSNTITIREY